MKKDIEYLYISLVVSNKKNVMENFAYFCSGLCYTYINPIGCYSETRSSLTKIFSTFSMTN